MQPCLLPEAENCALATTGAYKLETAIKVKGKKILKAAQKKSIKLCF